VTIDENALALLTQRMAELGAPDPGSWASSEITEGIAQQARYLVLRRIWAVAIAPWRDQQALRRYSSLARLLDNGTDPDLLATAIRQVVLETVVSVISVIDDGFDRTAPGDAPGWALMETHDDGSAMTLTGRDVGGLHESLLNRCSACARLTSRIRLIQIERRLDEPLPGGPPRAPVRRGDLLEIQAWEVGHADGHVAPLQGGEEFFAGPQCPFGLGLGKERDALVIQLQWMVDDVS
jgi:hypothetical protein